MYIPELKTVQYEMEIIVHNPGTVEKVNPCILVNIAFRYFTVLCIRFYSRPLPFTLNQNKMLRLSGSESVLKIYVILKKGESFT